MFKQGLSVGPKVNQDRTRATVEKRVLKTINHAVWTGFRATCSTRTSSFVFDYSVSICVKTSEKWSSDEVRREKNLWEKLTVKNQNPAKDPVRQTQKLITKKVNMKST